MNQDWVTASRSVKLVESWGEITLAKYAVKKEMCDNMKGKRVEKTLREICENIGNE